MLDYFSDYSSPRFSDYLVYFPSRFVMSDHITGLPISIRVKPPTCRCLPYLVTMPLSLLVDIVDRIGSTALAKPLVCAQSPPLSFNQIPSGSNSTEFLKLVKAGHCYRWRPNNAFCDLGSR
jgi:hypothetical protein